MRRWVSVLAGAVLLILGLGLGCDGFFVDPVLTGVAVGPAATIQTGTAIQMIATGSYNDGSQKKLSKNVYWASASPQVATINTSGVATGVGSGQAVISAAVETVTGSATVTVIVGNLSSIQVTSQNGFDNITYGSSEQFVATGIASGQQINLTDAVTWSTNPASIPNVSIDPTTGIFGSMQFTVHQ